MAAIRDTQPPRLPKLSMDRKGLIESRLSSLIAEDDQDSRRFFDQQASTVDMTAAALLNCEFRNLAIDTIIAERTHVNHVLTDSCRTALLDICSIGMENSIAVRCAFGSVQANAAKIIGMEIRGCRIDYLNCRDAICRDIMFRDCEIGELDGNGARLSRIAFTGTRIPCSMPYAPMWICVVRGYGRFAMSIHWMGPPCLWHRSPTFPRCSHEASASAHSDRLPSVHIENGPSECWTHPIMS